jgi:hypothetical protein
MVEFIKWPSIELFHNLKKDLDYKGIAPIITFTPKIKLDGTNAAVQVHGDGTIVAQSRNQIITPDKDNAGFAAWVECEKEYFLNLAKVPNGNNITIFGEWCGSGIQKRTAISAIGKRIFAVFAIKIGKSFVIEPSMISHYMSSGDHGGGNAAYPSTHPHRDIYILPFGNERITIDFSDIDSIKKGVEAANAAVACVEKQDPWVVRTFEVDGLGEGLVYYASFHDTGCYDVDYSFKAKGEKHRVTKSKEAVETDPEVLKSMGEFVEKFVTEQRMMQGLDEGANGDTSMKSMGAFLKWINQDVAKEGRDELEESGIEWKQVQKPVTIKAKKWFMAKSSELQNNFAQSN